jgi:hypothetical protein
MKTTFFRWLLIVPALLFVDWLIMIFFGCIANLCHAGNGFFCSVYCYSGITLLLVSAFLALYLGLKKKFRRQEVKDQILTSSPAAGTVHHQKTKQSAE